MLTPCTISPNVFPLKHFIQRSRRPTLELQVLPNIVPVLPWIIHGKGIIPPMPFELQPSGGISAVIRLEGSLTDILARKLRGELVDICIQCRVPSCYKLWQPRRPLPWRYHELRLPPVCPRYHHGTGVL